MVLTNNWMMIIWLLTAGIFVSIAIPQQQVAIDGCISYRWSVTAALLLLAPYIIWAGFRGNTADTAVYRNSFLQLPDTLGEISAYLQQNPKDKGFSILSIVLKTLIGNSDTLFFLIIAAFQMISIGMIYRKYSCDYLLSIFLFIASTDYFSWMMNGMRQFIAVAITFLCAGMIQKKKYIMPVLLIILASTIHGSALVMLPAVFITSGKAWNKKTLLFIAGMLAAIVFIGQFTNLMDFMMSDTQYGDVMTNEIWMNDDGTSILRVLVYTIPAILAWIGRKHIEKAENPMVNLCVNMSVLSAGFYFLSSVTSGIYVGRIPIYMSLYSYILLPWLIKNIFTKKTSRIINIICVGCYIIFFYYQMFISWG